MVWTRPGDEQLVTAEEEQTVVKVIGLDIA